GWGSERGAGGATVPPAPQRTPSRSCSRPSDYHPAGGVSCAHPILARGLRAAPPAAACATPGAGGLAGARARHPLAHPVDQPPRTAKLGGRLLPPFPRPLGPAGAVRSAAPRGPELLPRPAGGSRGRRPPHPPERAHPRAGRLSSRPAFAALPCQPDPCPAVPAEFIVAAAASPRWGFCPRHSDPLRRGLHG